MAVISEGRAKADSEISADQRLLAVSSTSAGVRIRASGVHYGSARGFLTRVLDDGYREGSPRGSPQGS